MCTISSCPKSPPLHTFSTHPLQSSCLFYFQNTYHSTHLIRAMHPHTHQVHPPLLFITQVTEGWSTKLSIQSTLHFLPKFGAQTPTLHFLPRAKPYTSISYQERNLPSTFYQERNLPSTFYQERNPPSTSYSRQEHSPSVFKTPP